MHETLPVDPPGTHRTPPDALWSPAQRRAGLVAVLGLAAAGLWTLRGFLPALGWAVILAISLWPWRQRAVARWPGGAGFFWPALLTKLVALFFVIPLVMVAGAVVSDSHAVIQWLANARAQGIALPGFVAGLPMGGAIAGWWQANLATPQAISHIHLQGASHLGEGGHLVAEALHRLVQAVFMLLVLFFLLRDGEKVAGGIEVGCRRLFGAAGVNVGAQALRAIRGTVNGLVVVGLGEGLLMGLVYALAGVPHAALLALLTGLLSVVPLGATVAVLLAAGIVAAGGAMLAGAVVAAVGLVVIFIADHFVRPVMIGDATRLPFLWVLLGILGGVEVWGLIGLVLGPALIAVLMLLWREFIGAQPGALNPVEE